ncbi:MAG TPA: hypothetical protein VF101_20060 [Gaiellaceae bacterium]
MQEPMANPGVMTPPVRYETSPLLGGPQPPRPGLMTPTSDLPQLDHGPAIRTLLWLVATALGAAELLLLTAPSG